MTRLERIDELCRLRSSLGDTVCPYNSKLDRERFLRQLRRYKDALSEVIDREVNEEERNRQLCQENYAAQMESLGYNADGNKK